MTRKRGKILVTGGTGYIGSHLLVALIDRGYDVLALDNLSNSFLESLHRVEQITGYKVPFLKVDLVADALIPLFKRNPQNDCNSHIYPSDTARHGCLADITGIIHCAGLKAVGESATNPLKYYEHNVYATLKLLMALKETILSPNMVTSGINMSPFPFIFSSSAMVYGHSKVIPIHESNPCLPTSPYGTTKLVIESMISNFADSLYKTATCVVSSGQSSPASFHPLLMALHLRYFNPVGAHPSGLLGEHPQGIPNNLFPYLGKVLTGQLDCLSVFGNDWPTPDGTGVRDYIHIMDLVDGHIDALQYAESLSHHDILANNVPISDVFNLGLGKGYSVLEMVQAFETACGKKIKFKFTERRYGDVATLVATSEKSNKVLQWYPKYSIDDMCRDYVKWLKINPNGYL